MNELYQLFLQVQSINWDTADELRLYKNGGGTIYTKNYHHVDDSYTLYSLLEWDTIEEGIEKLQKWL